MRWFFSLFFLMSFSHAVSGMCSVVIDENYSFCSDLFDEAQNESFISQKNEKILKTYGETQSLCGVACIVNLERV